jgi:peroxiredoxin
VVVGINVDDPAEVTREHAQKKGLSYPIAVDLTHETQASYGVDKLPSLVVIDKQGRVLAYLTGVVDEAALDEVITAAM